MRAILVLLLVTPVLVGCLGSSDPGASLDQAATDQLPTGEVDALDVLSVKEVTQQGWGVEPSVAVGPEGTIYVTSPGGRETREDSRLWVSRDGGGSFDHIEWLDPSTGLSNLPVGFEGDVAVDAAGTAYFVDLTVANTQIASSDDQGRSWLLHNPAVFAVGGGDREWVAAGPEDLVVVTWNQAPTGYWIAVSTDGGLTFPTQTLLPDSNFGVGAAGVTVLESRSTWAGVPAVAPDGTIYAARPVDPDATDDPDAIGPTLYRSTDTGESFTEHLVHPTGNRTGYLFIQPAVDEARNVYVAWAEQADDRVKAYYAVSTDAGESWSPPVRVSHHAGVSAMPWIEAGEQGHIAVAFYGAPDATGEPHTVDEEAAWFPYVTEVRDAHTGAPQQATARLSDDALLTGPMCMSGLGCNTGDAPGSRSLGDYLMVDIGADGDIHTVWTGTESSVHWALSQGQGVAP